MKEKNTARLANLALLTVAIVWGGGFVATKTALSDFTPLYLMATRFSIGFLLLALIFSGRLRRIKRIELIGGCVIGVFLYLGFATQTIGLQFTTPGKQAFLTGTNVIIVPFLYWLIHKKRPGAYALGGAALCFIGIAALTYNPQMTINIGDLLTLVCALFFAAHIVSTGFYAEDLDPINLAIMQFGVAGALSIITALIFEPPMTMPGTTSLLAVTYLTLVSTCLAFILQTIGQKYTVSTQAAILLSMESVFGSLFSVIFLGEIFTPRMIFGCLFILISVITVETKWEFLRPKDKPINS